MSVQDARMSFVLWTSKSKPFHILRNSNPSTCTLPHNDKKPYIYTSLHSSSASQEYVISQPLSSLCTSRNIEFSTLSTTQKSLDQENEPDESVPSCQKKEQQADLKCAGCGVVLQVNNTDHVGFIPKDKLKKWQMLAQESSSISDHSNCNELPPELPTEPLICQRCFSLKHYNTALNIALKSDDYLTHLSSLVKKRALILLMVDVTDFPASVFPSLNTLISSASRVVIVANKVDLLPKGITKSFWKDFENSMLSETTRSSLVGCDVMGVQFVSARTGQGLEELSNKIVNAWGNRGDVFLLGCTNVGKSTLFNRLLTLLCGAKPGELNTESNVSAPMATISQLPGTTLGLLSFPLMSVGKIKRLQHQRRESERMHLQGDL